VCVPLDIESKPSAKAEAVLKIEMARQMLIRAPNIQSAVHSDKVDARS
jgi:hypothetical protein